MSVTEAGRERLQRALVKLSRTPRAGEARSRGRQVPPPGEGASRAGRAIPVPPGAVSPGPVFPEAGPQAGVKIELPPELAGLADFEQELLDRLDRIEERLGDIQRQPRPLPATRELFGEWVRLRRWEEIPFGDFLKMRRGGLI